jgi:hypothetical protein
MFINVHIYISHLCYKASKKTKKGSITWFFQCLENSFGIGFDVSQAIFKSLFVFVKKIKIFVKDGQGHWINHIPSMCDLFEEFT